MEKKTNQGEFPVFFSPIEVRPDGSASVTPRAPPQAVGGAASPEMRLELRRISTFYTK